MGITIILNESIRVIRLIKSNEVNSQFFRSVTSSIHIKQYEINQTIWDYAINFMEQLLSGAVSGIVLFVYKLPLLHEQY